MDSPTPVVYPDIGPLYSIAACRLTRALARVGQAKASDEPWTWKDTAEFDRMQFFPNNAPENARCELGLQSGDLVLDIGSGFGGAGRYLSQKYDIKVIGIEMLEELHKLADDLNRKNGCVPAPNSSLTFPTGSYLGNFLAGPPLANMTNLRPFNLPRLPDHIMSFLCFLHLPESDRVPTFRKAAGLLKPGGKIYIEDFYTHGVMGEYEASRLARATGCRYLPTKREYFEHLIDGGFKNIQFVDVTHQWKEFAEVRYNNFLKSVPKMAPDDPDRNYYDILGKFYLAMCVPFGNAYAEPPQRFLGGCRITAEVNRDGTSGQGKVAEKSEVSAKGKGKENERGPASFTQLDGTSATEQGKTEKSTSSEPSSSGRNTRSRLEEACRLHRETIRAYQERMELKNELDKAINWSLRQQIRSVDDKLVKAIQLNTKTGNIEQRALDNLRVHRQSRKAGNQVIGAPPEENPPPSGLDIMFADSPEDQNQQVPGPVEEAKQQEEALGSEEDKSDDDPADDDTLYDSAPEDNSESKGANDAASPYDPFSFTFDQEDQEETGEFIDEDDWAGKGRYWYSTKYQSNPGLNWDEEFSQYDKKVVDKYNQTTVLNDDTGAPGKQPTRISSASTPGDGSDGSSTLGDDSDSSSSHQQHTPSSSSESSTSRTRSKGKKKERAFNATAKRRFDVSTPLIDAMDKEYKSTIHSIGNLMLFVREQRSWLANRDPIEDNPDLVEVARELIDSSVTAILENLQDIGLQSIGLEDIDVLHPKEWWDKPLGDYFAEIKRRFTMIQEARHRAAKNLPKVGPLTPMEFWIPNVKQQFAKEDGDSLPDPSRDEQVDNVAMGLAYAEENISAMINNDPNARLGTDAGYLVRRAIARTLCKHTITSSPMLVMKVVGELQDMGVPIPDELRVQCDLFNRDEHMPESERLEAEMSETGAAVEKAGAALDAALEKGALKEGALEKAAVEKAGAALGTAVEKAGAALVAALEKAALKEGVLEKAAVEKAGAALKEAGAAVKDGALEKARATLLAALEEAAPEKATLESLERAAEGAGKDVERLVQKGRPKGAARKKAKKAEKAKR
jgi:SAM-dependent methyltransferase